MSTKRFAAALACCLYALAPAPAVAQQPDPAAVPDPLEQSMLQQAAKELDACAALCFKNGFPRKARDLWLELLAEYDTDHAAAREALGFVRVGSAWQRKTGFDYPQQDELSASTAKMLASRIDALGQRLGTAHREMAQQLAAAGNEARSSWHLQRALRFLPDDGKVQAAAGLQSHEGVPGTPVELALLRRSRTYDRLIEQLAATVPEVAPADLRDERLDKAGVTYEAVKSEHFVVFGDHPRDVLIEAARWSERALAFCDAAFANDTGAASWPWPPKMPQTRAFAYFSQRSTWAEVVRKNASSLRNVAFILEHTSSCSLGGGRTGLFIAGFEETATVYDYAVRRVVQGYSLLGSPALEEGIGHAVVGMFFGRNLIFNVAPPDEKGTVSGPRDQRFELPDLEVWKELARDLAFDKAKAPAARLPLIQADKFTNEERIKAWSFCDYLLRRDPKLLLDLDKTKGKSRNEGEVIAAFVETNKLDLRAVEADWRGFYTGDSPALRAIRNKVTPLEAVAKDAPAWLEQFNRTRAVLKRKQVGWSAALSTDCRMHVDYLRQNKGERGAASEHTQESGKPGATGAGRTFAQLALVWTRDKDPKKAMATWLSLPGYRDALLDQALATVGLYADDGIVAIDVARGRIGGERSTIDYYPFSELAGNRMKESVPAAVDVELLGPEVKTLLEQNGHGKQKQVGFPISAHFHAGSSGTVQCDVTIDGAPVEGVLVRGNGPIRRTSAPGLWVFYPFAPLRKGVDVRVQWKHAHGDYVVVFTAG